MKKNWKRWLSGILTAALVGTGMTGTVYAEPELAEEPQQVLLEEEPEISEESLTGTYYVISGDKAEGKDYLAIDENHNGGMEPGNGAIVWNREEKADHWWAFREAGQGEYEIINGNSGLVLGLSGTEAGAALLQEEPEETDLSQRWLLEPVQEDSYRIQNVQTGLYMAKDDEMSLGWRIDTVQEELDEESDAQIWSLEESGNYFYSVRMENGTASPQKGTAATGETLDFTLEPDWGYEIEEVTCNGSPIEIYPDEDGIVSITAEAISENLYFNVQTKEASGEPGEDPDEAITTEISEERYYLENKAENVVAGIWQGSADDGAYVVKWQNTSSEDQRWRIASTETDGEFKLYNAKTEKMMEPEGRTAPGRVVQNSDNEKSGQVWIWEEAEEEGYARLKNKATGLYLGLNHNEAPYEEEVDEYYLIVEEASDSPSQLWKLDEVKLPKEGDDWIVHVPSNNYPGRNQCLSPRVTEGPDGTLYCTFESGERSENTGEFVFPVFESKNKGKNWTKVGEIVNDDRVHPDEWLNSTNGEAAQEGDAGAKLYQWQMHNCPQLFVLPEQMGELPAGTLICAGDAVTIEKDASYVSDAGDGGLWKTSLDLYYSTDQGRTWNYISTIAEGGRNIMGYDPVWEPYFVWYEGQLICFYSDERVDEYDNNQKLVHQTTTDGIHWSEVVDDVMMPGNGKRPGMPVVTQMTNGRWMMVYEGVGISNPLQSFIRTTDDPLDWRDENGDISSMGVKLWNSGSPYVITLQDGRLAANTGETSEVLINTEEDGSGAWIPYTTDAPAGYNRCLYQLSSGELLINGSLGFSKQDNYIFIKSLDPKTDLVGEVDQAQYLFNKANGEVAGIWQGSKDDRAQAVTWEKTAAPDQMWIPKEQEDGSFILENYNSKKVLAAQDQKEGSPIIQTDAAEGQENQIWKAEKAGDGEWRLKNQGSGLYLTWSEEAQEENNLVQSSYKKRDSQVWSFDAVTVIGENFEPADIVSEEFQNTVPEVTVSVTENNEVMAEWEPIPNAGSYGIFRKAEGETGYSLLKTVGKDIVSCADKTAEPGNTYCYTVKGFMEENGQGLSTQFSPAVKVTLKDNSEEIFQSTMPSVKAEVQENGNVNITWEPVENARSYRIYRKEPGESFKGIANTEEGKTLYTDTSAKPGRTYYYTVKGFWEEDAQGICTRYPSDVTVTIPVNSLETPAVSTRSVNYCTVEVRWNKIPGADKYVIYRKEAKPGTSFKSIASVTGGVLKYRDGNAKMGVNYYYTVKACAGSISSGYQRTVTGKAVPSSPGLKASGNSRGVTVTWTGSKAGDNRFADGYRIFRKTVNGSWKTVGTVGANTRSFTDTTGERGKKYVYTVRAYVKQGGGNLWGTYHTAGVAGARK